MIALEVFAFSMGMTIGVLFGLAVLLGTQYFNKSVRWVLRMILIGLGLLFIGVTAPSEFFPFGCFFGILASLLIYFTVY